MLFGLEFIFSRKLGKVWGLYLFDSYRSEKPRRVIFRGTLPLGLSQLGLGQRHEFIKSAMFSVFASTAPKELIGRVPNSRLVGFAEHTRLSFLLLPPRYATRLSSASSPSSKSSSWSSSSSPSRPPSRL